MPSPLRDMKEPPEAHCDGTATKGSQLLTLCSLASMLRFRYLEVYILPTDIWYFESCLLSLVSRSWVQRSAVNGFGLDCYLYHLPVDIIFKLTMQSVTACQYSISSLHVIASQLLISLKFFIYLTSNPVFSAIDILVITYTVAVDVE